MGVLIFGLVVTHGLPGLALYLSITGLLAHDYAGGLIMLTIALLFLRAHLAREYRRMCFVRFYHRRVIKLSRYMERLMKECDPEIVYGGRSLTHNDGFLLSRSDNCTMIMTTTGSYVLGWSPVCLWSPEPDFTPWQMEIATEDQLVALLHKFRTYR